MYEAPMYLYLSDVYTCTNYMSLVVTGGEMNIYVMQGGTGNCTHDLEVFGAGIWGGSWGGLIFTDVTKYENYGYFQTSKHRDYLVCYSPGN